MTVPPVKNKEAITIALDCAGGDHAPHAVIEGASIAAKDSDSPLRFVFCGNEAKIKPLLSRYNLRGHRIVHSDIEIPSNVKPSQILRALRSQYLESSMAKAMRIVSESGADAIVSSGDTGALMVIARYIFGLLPGIERPAIIGRMPNHTKTNFAMLDIGANIGSNADELMQFTLMGVAFAHIVLSRQVPRVGILNIGVEDTKGSDVIKSLANTLKNYPANGVFEFIGYIEPSVMFKGMVDVIVCDGFVGNISLKTLEGTASMIKHYIGEAFSASVWSKIGYFFARKSLRRMMMSIDPRNSNGALLVGLNGLVIKSHGSSDSLGFANAIKIAVQLVESKLNSKITEELERFDSVSLSGNVS